MGAEQIIFFFLAAFTVVMASLVVFSKNPVHSVLFLILTMFGIAGHYLSLNAQFLAVVHIIVYAGAIMVLFLFVIMLLNLNKESEPRKTLWWQLGAVIGGGSLMLTLIASFQSTIKLPIAHEIDSNIGLVKPLGKVLFTEYVVPFEISSVLFLAALVGAVLIGQRKQEEPNHS
ncbi:MAG: NADH-quinone oxidoreductase subunit J [Bacteroidetes bacterium]|nr:NADH-quinone oxidoreductase subunit J [Bacteroidota bacterium]MBP7477272.1 NADH-quinone oxidoreductase subunit J [Chitinophagales bacterium]